jgi:hypothetical protein
MLTLKIPEPFVETLRAKTKDRNTGLSELGIDAVIIEDQILRISGMYTMYGCV